MEGFKNEKEMQSFFRDRLKIFSTDYGLPEVISIGSETWIKSINKIKTKNEEFYLGDLRRIDLLINHADDSLSVFELKNNVKKGLYLDTGIIQLLKYKTIIEDKYNIKNIRLFLVSSNIDYYSAMMVEKFNLPINFVLLKRDGYSTYGVKKQ